MKITIIIPSYNTSDFLEECVDSAFSQTYKNIEVILIDNESTDNTHKIIENIAKKYPNLIIGSAPNIFRHSWEEPVNMALSLSTGDYFTILGSDDYIDKEYIEKCVKFLQNGKINISLFQSGLKTFNNNNRLETSIISHSYNGLEDLKNKMLSSLPVSTPTVFYSLDLYKKGLINWNSDKFLGACDYNLFCDLVDRGYYIYNYPKWTGYNYRWHPNQSTWGMKQEKINYDKIIQDYWNKKWKINIL